MSDPIRPDLNTTLANAAVSFDNKARTQREKLRELERSMRANLDGMVDPPADAERAVRERFAYEMTRARAAAERWEARAAEARRGNILMRQEDVSDADYMQEFGDVMGACQEESRVTYRLPTAEESMQQQSAAGLDSSKGMP